MNPISKAESTRGLRMPGEGFTAYRDQAFGIGAIFCTIEIAVEVDGYETDMLHAITELESGIDRVLEIVGLIAAVAKDEPFVADASPIVEDSVAFHDDGAIRQVHGDGGLKDARETLFSKEFDEANPTRRKRSKNILENGDVFLSIVEVTKRSKHADDKRKSGRTDKIAHVLLNPLDAEAGGTGSGTSLVEEEGGSIDASDFVSQFGEGDAAATGTTAKIECGLTRRIGKLESGLRHPRCAFPGT
jgi:hypothetical protein